MKRCSELRNTKGMNDMDTIRNAGNIGKEIADAPK